MKKLIVTKKDEEGVDHYEETIKTIEANNQSLTQ